MAKLNAWTMAFLLVILCTATTIVGQAQTFTTLLTFDGSNGAGPKFRH
jgi:hypothetical protein